MFYTKQTSISQFILHGNHVLNFLENRTEAQGVLAIYGFGATQLQEGRALFNQVQIYFRTVQEQQRRQVVATDDFHRQWQQVKQCYQIHLQAARRVLGRDAQQLVSPMPSRYAPWMEHVQSFYSAMLSNSDYQQTLQGVNIAPDDLLRVNQMIASVMAYKDQQAQMHSNARSALQQRDQEIERSKRWFEALMSLARVAFKDQPALLTAMHAAPVRTEAERKATRQLIAERKAAKRTAVANGTPPPQPATEAMTEAINPTVAA